AASCIRCHGPKRTRGQLRLDIKSRAMKGGISGPVIIPGNSKDSRLVKRILGEGDEPRMPRVGDPLKKEQIELIKKWIDQGAVWPEGEDRSGRRREAAKDGEFKQHWAYVRPVRPALPGVKNKSWVRNSIDRFVLARLEREGLGPSAEADRTTL